MNTLNTIKQLNELGQIKPDAAWKETTRDVLMSQISGSTNVVKLNWSQTIQAFIPDFVSVFYSRGMAVSYVILLVIAGAGFSGLKAARDTVPGDSLYAAKIITEKTQYALTFNEAEKAKLNLEFATKRAKEIELVLNAQEANGQADEKVAKLSEDFKIAIEGAKKTLDKMQVSKASQAVTVAKNGPTATATAELKKSEEEPAQVFSANLGKEEKGIQVSDPEGNAPVEKATSSAEKAVEPSLNANGLLDEAQKLLDSNDIAGTLTKLDEANKLLNDAVESGEVKGVEEVASSSEGME